MKTRASDAGAKARDVQRAASEPAASVWVAANAGTGKTHVLTSRVARLLFAGHDPARILCLTYTKAAAAEMTSRLFDLLGSWSTKPDAELKDALQRLEARNVESSELPKARRLFARAIETPGGLKIGTIHAFCANLLGRFPLEAELPPDFAILDERTSAVLSDEAYRDLLASAGSDDETGAAVGDLLEFSSAYDFSRAIATAAQELPHVPLFLADARGRDALARGLRQYFGLAPALTEDSLLQRAADVPPGLLDRAIGALAAGSKRDRDNASLLVAARAVQGDPGAFVEAYCRFLLTAKGTPRTRLLTKGAENGDAGLGDALAAEQARVLAALSDIDAAACARLTASLLDLARGFKDRLDARKSAGGLVSYDDLIAATRRLLERSGSEWVLYRLDGGLDHVLIDEAQDTSPDQWDILNALSAEFFVGEGARGGLARTYFAVGDEKQSIYSFQGAEPQRFSDERARTGERVLAAGADWRALSLEASFRSVPAVLDAVDRTFAPPEAHLGLGGGAPSHVADRAGAAGLVEIWPVFADEALPEADDWARPFDYVAAADAEERLAAAIAGTVADWIASGERLAASGKRIGPEDVLILVQHRDAYFEAQIRALKERGLPVAGADRLKLADEIAVEDLLAAARAALLPEDDLNLAAVLKSPLVGLDEEALFDLAHGRRASLWSALQRRAAEPAFAQAHERLHGWRARADLVAPFEFFSRLLGEEGGRRRLLARLGPDIADPVDELLSLALAQERAGVPSLQGFLQWIAAGPGDIKRDMEEAQGRIRVMTVHGAKGLEANIVFLADAHRVPMKQKLGPLFRTEDGVPLRRTRKGASFAALDGAVEAAERRQREEYHRLLYVAMTRARDRLYVCGYNAKGEAGESSWHGLVARGLEGVATRHVTPEGRTVLRYETGAPLSEEPRPERMRPIFPAMPEALRAGVPRERSLAAQSPSQLAQTEAPPALSPIAGEGTSRFRRGQAIHRLVELLPGLPPERRGEAARTLVAHLVPELPEDARGEIVATTLALFRDPTLAALFGPKAEAEVAIAGHVPEWGDAGRLHGRIDRLLVEESRIALVDVKTNRPAPASPEDVAEAYVAQLAGYRALLREAYPGRHVEAYLLWTDGPRLMAIPEARIDDAHARLSERARS